MGTEVNRPNDEITGREDLLDPRDIAERLKYLTSERDELESSQLDEFLEDEIGSLQGVVDEGIDDILVHEDYFQEYAEELAMDIGAIDRSQRNHWPYTCLDWEQAAEELKQDYSVIDIRGGTYYYRS